MEDRLPDRCRFRPGLLVAGIGAIILLAGCASAPPFLTPVTPDAVRACLEDYAELDRAVDAAGVRDAEAHRLEGFPHLRINRFVASFRDLAVREAAALDALLAAMAASDRRARGFEIANLPATERERLARSGILMRWESCTTTLVAHDRADPARRAAILERATVPDDYAAWKRALGLYALTSIPFRAGVSRWEAATRKVFSQPPSAESPQRYRLSPAHFAPDPKVDLLRRHAPEFVVDTAGDVDQPGAPRWRQGAITVDTSRPIVYAHFATTRFGGENLNQLVYQLWFPARPANGAFDLLSGHLDSVIVRLTLDRDGEVLVADSIHACGCYHLFFPSSRLSPRPPPSTGIEWMFSPAALPALKPGERLRIHLARGTHYLTGLDAVSETADEAMPYELRDAGGLRSLPLDEPGERRSLYGPDGFVAGSERGERFLFWPMGIANPGAMRQWGHHATAFVGRRHFDDPDLFERRFSRVSQHTGVKVQ